MPSVSVPQAPVSLDALPSMPAAALRIVSLCEDPELEISTLADTVALDPALSARILKTANSAAYSPSSAVTSLDRAMVMIGTKLVKLTALGFVVSATLSDEIDADEEVVAQVWRQCLVKSVACREIARMAHRQLAPEAFLSGLFDGMGQLLGMVTRGDTYGPLLAAEIFPSADSEREVLGMSTGELVRAALDSWGMPKLYTRVLAAAEAGSPGFDDSTVGRLAATLVLAREATHLLLGYPGGGAYVDAAATALRVDRDAVDALAADIGEHVATLADALGVDLRGEVDFPALLAQAREQMIHASRELAEESLRKSSLIHDLKNEREQFRRDSLTDRLTGLANRGRFVGQVEQALASTTGGSEGSVAVLLVDLDGFKNVNDSLGHPIGDKLLVEVAERFRHAVGEARALARLGGDEFAILVDRVGTPDTVDELGQRVLDALSEPAVVGGRQVAISASVGIAVSSAVDGTAVALLRNADAAMYRAKRDGKSCCRRFEPWMHSAAVRQLEVEQDLRAAVGTGVISVHYQPVVDARTGVVASFEALARWDSPEIGVVRPDVFIPLAEETGVIVELGRLVLQEACFQARTWWDSYPSVRPGVAVNVSRRQLIEPTFADEVADALRAAGLPGSALTLEVTETVLGSDLHEISEVLEQVRRTGVRVAIDDFGTGFSSLAALADLPIDTLKIDKRFVDSLLRDDRGAGLVTAIIQLAHTLDLATTAEGVEEPEQHAELEALGCDQIQGYLHAPPMPATATYGFIEDSVGGRPPLGQGRSVDSARDDLRAQSPT